MICEKCGGRTDLKTGMDQCFCGPEPVQLWDEAHKLISKADGLRFLEAYLAVPFTETDEQKYLRLLREDYEFTQEYTDRQVTPTPHRFPHQDGSVSLHPSQIARRGVVARVDMDQRMLRASRVLGRWILSKELSCPPEWCMPEDTYAFLKAWDKVRWELKVVEEALCRKEKT